MHWTYNYKNQLIRIYIQAIENEIKKQLYKQAIDLIYICLYTYFDYCSRTLLPEGLKLDMYQDNK